MTNAIAASLEQAAKDLDQLGTKWALVGGFAVSARAEPRFTHDVDVCVLVDTDAQAERIALQMTGFGYSVASIVEHERFDRLATLRLVSPVPGGMPVDLLFASSGIEREVVQSAEVLEILPDLAVPVARSPHLVVLKLLARDDDVRPQDAMDLRALRRVLTADDADEVLRLVSLVSSRGFDRERDLRSLAREYLASA